MSLDLLGVLDRPIAFHRVFITITGSVNAALMLSQALYWQRRSAGWWWKTAAQWHEETGLNRTELERAREALIVLGALKSEVRGMPARSHYQVDLDRLVELVAGARPKIGLEDVLKHERARLAGLSKVGYMRARKLGVTAELVSYEEVLINKGMVCGICGGPITEGVGRRGACLSFDHIIPLDRGGAHTKANIHPSHAHCNIVKGSGNSLLTVNKLDCPPQANKFADSKQTGLLTVSNSLYTSKTTSKTKAPELPTWLKPEAWEEFRQHRKAIKKPLTPLAETKAIKLLDELRRLGQDPHRIIDQSIANGWTGLFPLKAGKGEAPRREQDTSCRRPVPGGTELCGMPARPHPVWGYSCEHCDRKESESRTRGEMPKEVRAQLDTVLRRRVGAPA